VRSPRQSARERPKNSTSPASIRYVVSRTACGLEEVDPR
jgi:hypothetical protein